MHIKSIINPKNNRSIKVLAWKINPREIVAKFNAKKFKNARDLSYALLDDDQSIQLMEEQQYGDSARNNFGMRVFEQALDWSLGLKVLHFIHSAVKDHKIPKPFEVAVNRAGDVFVITATGRIL